MGREKLGQNNNVGARDLVYARDARTAVLDAAVESKPMSSALHEKGT